MPAPTRITKDAIVAAALSLTRAQGIQSLNARALAQALGCSTQPIFSNFPSMEALREAVLGAAYEVYLGYLRRELAAAEEKRYMATGLGYIRFAREESNLFRLLFMRDRTGEPPTRAAELDEVLPHLQAATGMSRAAAERFHLSMWIYVHGIAVMLVTSYLRFSWEDIRGLLSEAFRGQLALYQKEEFHECH